MILTMYQHVTSILEDEPSNSSDPKFVPDWLHGYLTNVEGIPRNDARDAVWKAIGAIKRARRRGIPSKARGIVREFLTSVGFCMLEDGNRKRVTLTDQRLRRILDRGDPFILPSQEAEAASVEAAKRGVRLTTAAVLVANSEDSRAPDCWRLYLKRRRKPNSVVCLDVVDLVLEHGQPEPGERRSGQALGPNDSTPIGPARKVVREWKMNPRLNAKHAEIAQLFLNRRR